MGKYADWPNLSTNDVTLEEGNCTDCDGVGLIVERIEPGLIVTCTACGGSGSRNMDKGE